MALRRLRSTLRAYRDLLGRPLGGRERRRLREVVEATSVARDAEVLMALIAEESAQPATHDAGAWLVARLDEKKTLGYSRVEKRLDHFAGIERRLRRRLSRVRIDLGNPHPQSQTLAELIETHTDDVEDDLAELRSPDQVEDAHRARISIKRLRYLVEPFKQDSSVARLVAPLKSLQELLGDLHDAHVALAEVAAALDDTATPAELRHGLAALSARLDARQARLFTIVDREWLHEPKLVTQARALAAELRKR